MEFSEIAMFNSSMEILIIGWDDMIIIVSLSQWRPPSNLLVHRSVPMIALGLLLPVGWMLGVSRNNSGGIALTTRPVVNACGRTLDGNTVPPFVGSSPRVHSCTSADGADSKTSTLLVLTILDVLGSNTL